MKVAIIGAGKLGYKLAEALMNGDNHVVLVDKNISVIQKISESLDVLTYAANGVQMDTFNELKIDTYDIIIAVTETDEKNIVICSIAKKLGCKKAIARIRDPEYVKQLELIKKEMSIDHIINPDLATSYEIFRNLTKQYSVYNENFAMGRVGMIEFNVKNVSSIIGKEIKDIASHFQNILIVAISRNGKIIIPNGDTELSSEDTLYLLGESDCIRSFSSQYNLTEASKNIKTVMILGGGKISYYLADRLSSFGIKVKIIEVNRERCKYLSENLDNVLILHGDGTDLKLLEEENINAMDAFVSTTGYDEENLLMALMAKNLGVQKVIAKVSRQNYIEIIEKLGIDVALNPVDITASNILRYIQGKKLVAVSHLLQGQAEVIELIAHDKMKILNKPLHQLDLPEGIIIGSIVRDGQVIIPRGDNMIKKGDRVVIFCLLPKVPLLETLIKPGKGGFFR